MTSRDGTERNYDIVLMIKKIALAIERKDTHELRIIAEELERWHLCKNWDDLDIRTKVFVEHVLLGFARIQLGLEELERGGDELTEISEEIAESEEDYWKNVNEAEQQSKLDEFAQEHTGLNIDRFSRRNLSKVDRREKFTCEKCGIEKRKSAPGVSNYKEVDGHKICGRCYRAFTNWFDGEESVKRRKQFEKLKEHYEKREERSWDEREKDKTRLHNNIRKLMRYFRKDDGQIDWKRYHEAERKEKERLEKEERNKARYKKNELSDEEKDDLK